MSALPAGSEERGEVFLGEHRRRHRTQPAVARLAIDRGLVGSQHHLDLRAVRPGCSLGLVGEDREVLDASLRLSMTK